MRPLRRTMIEISALAFHYGAEEMPVFDGFSWRVIPGESWAIIGPSGLRQDDPVGT